MSQQEKDVVVSGISQKTINPKPGQSWKAFVVYMILGNDGVTYETSDQEFYKSLKIGQSQKLKYETTSKSYNGKIYTTNKIITEKKSGMGSQAILERLDLMEKNIIETIRKMIEPQPKLSEVDDFIDIEEPGF